MVWCDVAASGEICDAYTFTTSSRTIDQPDELTILIAGSYPSHYVRLSDSTAMGSIAPSPAPISAEVRPDFSLLSKDDTLYEQDLFRNPSSPRPWLAYIDHKLRNGTLSEQAYVMERACLHLPRSYKLWKMYLEFRVKHLTKRSAVRYRAEYEKVNLLFERALVLLNKMPVIWELYLAFLLRQPLVTRTRRVFDRALRALPVTQHGRVWRLYKLFARSAGGLTAVKIWRRYVQIHPEDMEDYIDLLIETGHFREAVTRYIELLNNPRFVSKNVKSDFQLWNDMIELMVGKARQLTETRKAPIDVDRIIRSGIDRFPDQRGKLWAGLATYYITLGQFDDARDIFEEGITTVMTVRDFTTIFDACVEFEESLISGLMEAAQQRSRPDEEADFDLDISLARFEYLMDRRPFLLNDVLLRQNPNNVPEWEKRVALWADNDKEVVQTYTDAIATIHPKKATGKLHELFINFAKFYERRHDLSTARLIMDKAVKVPYKSVIELAETYIAWAELELRAENFDTALAVMAKAVQAPKRSTVDYFDDTLSPQQRLHKSWKAWSFYVDLAESVLPLEETRAIYDRIFELKIATPQTVVNYANLLEENSYFEESFKIYERGLDLFPYPVAFELWNLYLTKAVKRKISIERLRDLFEQAVENIPPQFAKSIYLLYGQLEEDRGLARSAMRIYDRATLAVSDSDRLAMYEFYITKAAHNFGLTSTRPIYERAIAALPDKEARSVCLAFASMEKKLGEIDRARAIYAHGSQFANPRSEKSYWDLWERFEVLHGNEDTFKEMLRIKRSVAATFATDVGYIAQQAVEAVAGKPGDQVENRADSTENIGADADAMELLEKQTQIRALNQVRAPVGFVAASTGPEGGNRARDPPEPAVSNAQALEGGQVVNPDALDLDDDED